MIQRMTSAVALRVALAVTSVALPVEVVTMMTMTAVVEEEVVEEDTLLVTTTVMVETVTTALVIPATTMEVVVLPVVSTVMPAARTGTEAVAELVAARTGTAAVVLMTVVLPANLSLTVTVTAATPVPQLRMRLLAPLRVAGAMAEAMRMIAADTEDREARQRGKKATATEFLSFSSANTLSTPHWAKTFNILWVSLWCLR